MGISHLHPLEQFTDDTTSSFIVSSRHFIIYLQEYAVSGKRYYRIRMNCFKRCLRIPILLWRPANGRRCFQRQFLPADLVLLSTHWNSAHWYHFTQKSLSLPANHLPRLLMISTIYCCETVRTWHMILSENILRLLLLEASFWFRFLKPSASKFLPETAVNTGGVAGAAYIVTAASKPPLLPFTVRTLYRFCNDCPPISHCRSTFDGWKSYARE